MDWAVSEGARLRVTISRNKDGIRGGLGVRGMAGVVRRATYEGLADQGCTSAASSANSPTQGVVGTRRTAAGGLDRMPLSGDK